jgi:hypothetical protein
VKIQYASQKANGEVKKRQSEILLTGDMSSEEVEQWYGKNESSI